MTRDLRISAAVEAFRGQELDARYLAYFECFNRRFFFESHEVLESLWLVDRQAPNAAFYKGLIQLAGGFVHIQKNRPGPAAALLRLARTNVCQYSAIHEGLDIDRVRALIGLWLGKLETAGPNPSALLAADAPELHLT
jgi:predicted metal-dependent hydrolase